MKRTNKTEEKENKSNPYKSKMLYRNENLINLLIWQRGKNSSKRAYTPPDLKPLWNKAVKNKCQFVFNKTWIIT